MSAVLEAHEPSAKYLSALQPRLVQHFELLGTAPGGVTKLRELILTLAVQGKLVPQDPADEPAHVALSRVAAERNRLIAAGVIKATKHLPKISDEETPFDIPASWGWARLAHLVRVLNGRAYSKQELLDSGPTPVLRVGNLFTSNHWYFSDLDLEPDKLCQPGDLLFAWSASFGPFIWDGPTAIFHYHIWKLDPVAPELFNSEYFHTFLLEKTAEIKAAGHGVSMVHMTKEKMEKIPVPVPPLAEQARIVTRVEELMRLCDALEAQGQLEAEQHAQLVQALLGALTASATPDELADKWQRVATHFDLLLDRPEAVDALEQTILRLAVRGLLVPQDPNDEPAIELLKKIRAEKDRLIAEGKIKSGKLLPQMDEGEKPFAVPSTWEWVRLDQIADSRLGKMLDKAKNSGKKYPYLRNANVQWHHIDLSDIKEISLETFELEEFRLRQGDLLICEGGYPGRCAIWNEPNKEMYFQKALHRVRPFGGIPAEFLTFSLEADSRSGALEKYFTGATIKHFVGQALDSYLVPLPPSVEMNRIVARVASLRRLCADLRQRLAARQTTQAHLAEALIDQVA